ncbi:hypothetical protein [Streptosporangium carneum]|uniref:hypothetical protein n=1 Tax=Streptosporangium carneum TaxID=47481 RepID=UPI0022F2DB67|nr:hypothetical protein [Streptosporangium carneum]
MALEAVPISAEWTTKRLLGEVALAAGTGIGGSGPNSRSERVANAALGVLARPGGMEVVAQLSRVQAKVRRKSILAKVKQILEATKAFLLAADATVTDPSITRQLRI